MKYYTSQKSLGKVCEGKHDRLVINNRTAVVFSIILPYTAVRTNHIARKRRQTGGLMCSSDIMIVKTVNHHVVQRKAILKAPNPKKNTPKVEIAQANPQNSSNTPRKLIRERSNLLS